MVRARAAIPEKRGGDFDDDWEMVIMMMILMILTILMIFMILMIDYDAD